MASTPDPTIVWVDITSTDGRDIRSTCTGCGNYLDASSDDQNFLASSIADMKSNHSHS